MPDAKAVAESPADEQNGAISFEALASSDSKVCGFLLLGIFPPTC